MERCQGRNTLLDFAGYQVNAALGREGGVLEQTAGIIGLAPAAFAFLGGHLLEAFRNTPDPLELSEIGSSSQSPSFSPNRTLKATRRVSGNTSKSLLPQEKKVKEVSSAALNQENLQELLNEINSNNLQLKMAIRAMYSVLAAQKNTPSTKEEFKCEGVACRIGLNPEKHQVVHLVNNGLPGFAASTPAEPQDSQPMQMKPTVIGKGSYKTHELRLKKIREEIVPFAFTKITAANLVQNPEIYKGLVLQQALDHPNIAQISLYFKNQDLCVECAYFNRRSLEKFIAKFPQESELHQLSLIKAILAPLAYLAKNKIHHRDVKLANYLIRYNGTFYELQLSDFDLAIDEDREYTLYIQDRNKQNSKENDTYTDGVFGGAANFMAPEYATVFMKGARSTDQELRAAATTKGDVWGAGICIYYLAFNQYPPFLKPIQIPEEQFPNIVKVTEQIIDELCSPHPDPSWPLPLIKWLLQPDPEKRISAEDALKAMGFVEQ